MVFSTQKRRPTTTASANQGEGGLTRRSRRHSTEEGSGARYTRLHSIPIARASSRMSRSSTAIPASPPRFRNANLQHQGGGTSTQYTRLWSSLPRRTPSLLVENPTWTPRTSSPTCSEHRRASTAMNLNRPSIATLGLFKHIPET